MLLSRTAIGEEDTAVKWSSHASDRFEKIQSAKGGRCL